MAQRWVWPKKPLREEVNPKGNAKYYAKADLVNSRTKETVYSIKVGDRALKSRYACLSLQKTSQFAAVLLSKCFLRHKLSFIGIVLLY